jgi:hypothetical protein
VLNPGTDLTICLACWPLWLFATHVFFLITVFDFSTVSDCSLPLASFLLGPRGVQNQHPATSERFHIMIPRTENLKPEEKTKLKMRSSAGYLCSMTKLVPKNKLFDHQSFHANALPIILWQTNGDQNKFRVLACAWPTK